MRTAMGSFNISEGEVSPQQQQSHPQQQQHPSPTSPWRSPVPYLFGGLAAMLGLIAFALLILACSYWKLSGNLESSEGDGDLEGGECGKGGEGKAAPERFEEKFVVVMPGEEKPSFIATPVSSRASSFGDRTSNKDKDVDVGNGEEEERKVEEGGEKENQDGKDHQNQKRNSRES